MSVTAETLMRQAGYTAEEWLRQSIESIDNQFGEGYAKENPVLVGAFMQAAGADEIAMHLRSLDETFSRMNDCVDRVADSISGLDCG